MASAASTRSSGLVLDLDPDLGRNIGPDEWEVAHQACRGELLDLPRGPWPGAGDAADREDLVAFVIVDGLLARELWLRDRCMVELLGRGDVLQPPLATEPPRLATETRLTAVSDLVLIVLGQPFVSAAARWPTLLTALQRRLEAQRESLAIQGLIAHLPNAQHRLLTMLWHLADRWGHVTPEGIVLPWPVSHEILGRLVAASRPTVTIALRGLEASDAVHRREDGSWLLTAIAERMINAIARPPAVTHSIGEQLMLYRRTSETIAETRALHAEAKQILLRRPARPVTNT
jgi:CRP-like cAMP-binding protein